MIRKQQDTREFMRGVLWMTVSLGSFIATAIAARELSANLNTFQILFFRSVVGFVVLCVFARKVLPELSRMASIRLNLLRNVIHFSGQYCWTFGVALLPLAEVFALEFTMPVWVAIFAALILGERVTAARIISIALSFIGVLLILRPGAGVIHPASFVVLVAAASFGLSAVLVKLLTRTCSPAVIVVWMVVMQLPMGLVMAIPDWQPVLWSNLPWFVVSGLCGMSAHYAMAQALRVLDASVAIPIDFFRVPLIAVVGFVLYGETVGPFLFAGAGLILLGNYLVLRLEHRRRRIPVPDS